jgi:hypothetical protein
MLMPLLGVGLQVSVQFGIVETLKKILKNKYGNPDGSLDPKYSFLCGGIAGIFSGIILVIIIFYAFRHPWIMQDLEFHSINQLMLKDLSKLPLIFIDNMVCKKYF